MDMGYLELALQALVVLLLAATLFYAVRLERALRAVKRDRTEYEDLIGNLRDSAQLVGDGIIRLKSAGETAGRELAARIEPAQTLANDLHFLIERAERTAARVEGLAKAKPPADPAPATRTEAPPVVRPPGEAAPAHPATGAPAGSPSDEAAPPPSRRAPTTSPGGLTDLQRIARMQV